jgi:hypothetical protein
MQLLDVVELHDSSSERMTASASRTPSTPAERMPPA